MRTASFPVSMAAASEAPMGVEVSFIEGSTSVLHVFEVTPSTSYVDLIEDASDWFIARTKRVTRHTLVRSDDLIQVRFLVRLLWVALLLMFFFLLVAPAGRHAIGRPP